MKIVIESIPHDQQRYETCGDWQFDEDGTLNVRVSHTTNDFDFLVGIHEAVEAWLCRKRGVTDADVTAFDKAFEADREAGDSREPGDDPDAPYRREHRFASSIERRVALELGIDWLEYDRRITALSQVKIG